MTTITWAHAVSGNFINPADWLGDAVPGSANDADLSASGTYTVISSHSNTVEGIETAAHTTLDITEGTFMAINGTDGGANNGTILVGNNAYLQIGNTAGVIAIAINGTGTILLDSTGSPTFLDGSSNEIILFGGGKLTLSNNANNRVEGSILDNVSDAISGAGTIAVLTFDNSGVINANATTPLIIFGAQSNNSGTMKVTSTGGLTLSTAVNNTGGIIEAATAGTAIDLDDGSITGGSVSTVAGSSIVGIFTDNTLDPDILINAGVIRVNNGGTFALGSTSAIKNAGVIALTALTGRTILELDGTVTLNGSGRVTLTDNSDNLIESNGASAALVNDNNRISGAGTIGDTNTALLNSGVIDGTGKNPLIIAPGSDDANSGLIESTSTGGVQIAGAGLGNDGVVAAATAGSHIDLDNTFIDGGTVRTAVGGTIDVMAGKTGVIVLATIINAGTLLVNGGSTFTLGANVDNTGTIIIDGFNEMSSLDLDGNVSLTGGGKIILNGGATLIATSGLSSTLTNYDTILGSGQINDSLLTFNNNGLIDATSMEINTGTNFITNSGVIESTGQNADLVIVSPVQNNNKLIAGGSRLAIDNILTGTGSLIIAGSGTLVLAKGGITENTTFAAGAAGTLTLSALATPTPTSVYGGIISGFGVNDTIELTGLNYVAGNTMASTTYSASSHDTTVTITNATDTVALTFAGNLTGHTFVVGTDGNGKTRLTDPVAKPAAAVTLASTANPPPSLINVTGASNAALLGSYMASTFASAEGHVSTQAAAATQNEAIVAHSH